MNKPETLYISPLKLGAWLALLLGFLIGLGLYAWPKYQRYLDVERAKTRVEVERILNSGKQTLPTTP